MFESSEFVRKARVISSLALLPWHCLNKKSQHEFEKNLSIVCVSGYIIAVFSICETLSQRPDFCYKHSFVYLSLLFPPFHRSVWRGNWGCKWSEKFLSWLVKAMQCCSWLLVLRALCSCTERTTTHDFFSLWETLVSTTCTSVCLSLLRPFWWGDVAVIWLISERAGGRLARWCLFFSFSTIENLLLSVSHISLRVHSVCWSARCLCFHSAGWLTLAPAPSWVTQLVIWRVSNCSHIQTSQIAKKVWFLPLPPDWTPVWSPQPAQQASPCSSTANRRLGDTHLPTPLCRVANEFQPRGTPFSQTLVFLSSLV